MKLNGIKPKRVKDTLFIPLPVEARRPIDGGCSCEHCKAHPGEVPQWDTLAVAADGEGHTWTVHYPELVANTIFATETKHKPIRFVRSLAGEATKPFEQKAILGHAAHTPGQGWKFYPNNAVHTTSRKYWPTWEACIPRWMKSYYPDGSESREVDTVWK